MEQEYYPVTFVILVPFALKWNESKGVRQMDSVVQITEKRKGRPIGVPNKQARYTLSLVPRSRLLAHLVKISPLIEKTDQKYSGRLLKGENAPLSAQMIETLPEDDMEAVLKRVRIDLEKVIVYLTSHGISFGQIAICPAYYYPTVSVMPALYVLIRKEQRALTRLRNQANRCHLHCYLAVGDGIPPQNRSLLYPECEGIDVREEISEH